MTGALTDVPSIEVASFCFLTSTFIVIIFLSKKRNFLKNMLQGLMRCFEAQNPSVHEILYYHKNSTGIWLEVITTAHPMPHCNHEDAIQNWHVLKCPMSSMSFKIVIIIHLIIFEVEVIPIKNEADLVVLFLCNYRDITAFKVTGNLMRKEFIHSTSFRIPFANILMSVDDFHIIPSATFHNIFLVRFPN